MQSVLYKFVMDAVNISDYCFGHKETNFMLVPNYRIRSSTVHSRSFVSLVLQFIQDYVNKNLLRSRPRISLVIVSDDIPLFLKILFK
jgi:hypothetical protein